MIRHLVTLARSRRRSLRHVAARLYRDQTGVLAAIAGGIGLLVVLGHLAAPALLVRPAEVAAGGAVGGERELVAGSAALETAFWLTAVAAAVASFRVMELLFRRRDIRAVESLPVDLSALFVDRLAASLLEALWPAAVLGLFFAPLVWHGASRVALLATGVAVAGLCGTVCFSLAVHLYAGELNARAAGAKSQGSGLYGGPGQVLVYAPGIALAGSAVMVLLARLAFGELLAPGGSSRGFAFGLAVLVGICVVALISAYGRFASAYPEMAARFREADLVRYDPPVDYQTSAYARGSRMEWLVPAALRANYRTLSLQYGRRHSLLRYSYVIGWFFAGVALTQWSRTAFPPWAVVSAPAVCMAILANPWSRSLTPPLAPKFAEMLPVERRQSTGAALLLGARETLLATVPYAVLVVLVDWSDGPAAALTRGFGSLGITLGLGGALAVAVRLTSANRALAIGVPLAATAGFTGLAFVAPPVAGAVGAVATAYLVVELATTAQPPGSPSSWTAHSS